MPFPKEEQDLWPNDPEFSGFELRLGRGAGV